MAKDSEKQKPSAASVDAALAQALTPMATEVEKSGSAIGKNIAEIGLIVTGTARVLLSPLKAVVWGYDKVEQWVVEEVQERLERVPEEHRVEPKLMIAGPTVDAMKYAGAEPSLRDLFANLLVTSMDSRTSRDAHPAFVEMIKQLTTDEAKLLRSLKPRRVYPLVDVRRYPKESPTDMLVLRRNFSLLHEGTGIEDLGRVPAYIDNLCRLEICSIPHGLTLSDKSVYVRLEEHPLISELRNRFAGDHIRVEHKALTLTHFGNLFLTACVIPKE